MTDRRYLGVQQVAERYGVKQSVVYEWVSRGVVPYRKLPGRKALLFDRSDLDLYDDGETKLERRKTPGGGIVCRPSAVTPRLQKTPQDR